MNKPPVWFWVVGVVALLWAGAGCSSYLHEVTMSPADLAAMPTAQADMWRAMPSWLFGVFAIAVWVGLAGAIALLLRRRIARALYIVSLIAVIVQFGYIFGGMHILDKMSFGEAAGFPIVIAVAQAVMIWFSGYATRQGWLK